MFAGRVACKGHHPILSTDVAASCGISPARSVVRGQPILPISPYFPCMARQHALSCDLIAPPITHPRTGATAAKRRKIETRLGETTRGGYQYKHGIRLLRQSCANRCLSPVHSELRLL